MLRFGESLSIMGTTHVPYICAIVQTRQGRNATIQQIVLCAKHSQHCTPHFVQINTLHTRKGHHVITYSPSAQSVEVEIPEYSTHNFRKGVELNITLFFFFCTCQHMPSRFDNVTSDGYSEDEHNIM